MSGGSGSISISTRSAASSATYGIFREYHRDRLADIAHELVRQHRLAVGLERFQPGEAEADRRQMRDIGVGPHGMHAGQGERSTGIDRLDAAVRHRRAHHAHRPLAGEIDVGGEAALPGQQRAVFQARDGTADEFGRPAHVPRISFAAARTALMMF